MRTSAVNIESVLRDVRYACSSLLRTPLIALTTVATVGLGLGLVAVVFTILNTFIFHADEVRNSHELFAVERLGSGNAESDRFTRAQYDALVRETNVFVETFARTPEIDAWIDGRRMEGPLVTGNFFHVLGVGAARGRTLTPSDDQPGAPPVIVLSHRAWSQYFAGDPGALSRTVLLNGAQVHIVGVMPERFRGLTVFAPDYWAPLSLIDQFRHSTALGAGRSSGASEQSVDIVGRLMPGVSPAQGLAQLLAWDTRDAAERSGETPPGRLALEPSRGTVPLSTDVLLLFTPLFFAFGLILMIGWANVANLLLARGVARQREIGIRLAVGASRSRIIRQLLTESLLLALISAALAFGISRLVLRAAAYAMSSTWDLGFGNLRVVVPAADWRVALFLLAGAIVSTLFFALVPALRATGLELVRAMRGEVVREVRPGRGRSALVAIQVTASALLLTCAAIFLRSSWAAAGFDPGFRTTDTVRLNILNEQRRGAILQVVNSEPSIVSQAASWPGLPGGRTAFAETVSGRSPVTYQFVSPEYFDVLGIDVVRGRSFRQTEQSASAAIVIVSETVARELWPGTDALGQVLRLEPDLKNDRRDADDPALLPRSFSVVGVARDVAGFKLGGGEVAGAGIYVPISAEVPKTSLVMRVRGDSERARHTLVDRLAAIDPNMAEVTTLRTIVRLAAYIVGIPFWLTLMLGALALLLTLSGLFSVVSYLIEQRTREIGVRMALGATGPSIGTLVLLQSARPVGIGLLVGSILTIGFGGALVAMPGAELIASSVRLFDPVAYAASLACVVTACTCAALIPALRAARSNPVAALRQS